MFDNNKFDHYSFDEIPLNRDLYIMDEKDIHEYESMMSNFLSDPSSHDYNPVGYVSHVTGRKVLDNSIELSWCANVLNRVHEVSVFLPKEQFIYCVGCWQHDEKPIVFVKSNWLENLYMRSYSVFAMIDAIGVKKLLKQDKLTKEMLTLLRQGIDKLAINFPEVLFISFADSLLLKSNWSVGTFDSEVNYTYKPEIFISLAKKICEIYKSCLGLATYAIITQGSNAYFDDPLLHISESKNHISLNSLGVPFAQLMYIDGTVRKNIKNEIHKPTEVYMDSQYYNSLKFKFSFDKQGQAKAEYESKVVSQSCLYYYNSITNVLNNLENEC